MATESSDVASEQEDPAELWRQLGGHLARALSALDASLAHDALSAEERQKLKLSRDNVAAALREHRKVTAEDVAAYTFASRAGLSIDVRCGGCGAMLSESPTASVAARSACPSCGSLARVKEIRPAQR